MKTPYSYDLHGLIRVRSDQRLPELAYFRSREVEQPDVLVEIARRPSLRRDGTIRYREVLNDLGFSIAIDRGAEQTRVAVSPLVAASPHVLYTNVVEPLLRWIFVRKGYALMHGACLAFGDRALFVTAKTDTGKTTTILHTLRSGHDDCAFLSDDMTIFGRDGQVMSYPKPLTISQHTLHAIGGAPLRRRERLFLRAQSRLHSREGRRIGMWLKDVNTPAATLNAVVQILVPPPKFMVDRLVPGTRYRDRASLASIVLIERGEAFEGRLDETTTVATLLANADDAYGFPPYPYLAERLSSWQGGDLGALERDIVTAAVREIPAVHLRSPRYDWHQRLPRLVGAATPRIAEPAGRPAPPAMRGAKVRASGD